MADLPPNAAPIHVGLRVEGGAFAPPPDEDVRLSGAGGPWPWEGPGSAVAHALFAARSLESRVCTLRFALMRIGACLSVGIDRRACAGTGFTLSVRGGAIWLTIEFPGGSRQWRRLARYRPVFAADHREGDARCPGSS